MDVCLNDNYSDNGLSAEKSAGKKTKFLNFNQKKENKEGAREETRGSARGCAHFAAEYTDVKPPRAHCAVATGAGPSFRAFDEVPDDAFQIIEQRSLLKCILTQKC